MSAASPQPALSPEAAASLTSLTTTGRMLMLTAAFLGWFFAGFHLSITSVVMRPASIDLLSRVDRLDGEAFLSFSKRAKQKPDASATAAPLTDAEREQLKQWEELVGQWFGWLTCAFLFGAAAGGLCFGALGDRFGRTKGMGCAILMYSLMAGAAYFADRPETLLVCWFLACMGVGGMWPNGVSLVSEAWSSLSRPFSAGLIGAAANIGIFLLSTLMTQRGFEPTPVSWRWTMLVAAAPAVLGVLSFLIVPESPLWLASRGNTKAGGSGGASTAEIFRPPYLGITLVGIALATVPLFGGWGSANWMVPWADQANAANLSMKAEINQSRAVTGVIGSFVGAWVANFFGRRLTYFLVSAIELAIAQYTFWYVMPTDDSFLWWVRGLGLFNGIYFGWLPYCLPEFFPTRARSAGAGVSFNFGRVFTAMTVFTTAALMKYFEGDYARIGRVTSLIFVVGMIVIWFAPDTSQKKLEEE